MGDDKQNESTEIYNEFNINNSFNVLSLGFRKHIST